MDRPRLVLLSGTGWGHPHVHGVCTYPLMLTPVKTCQELSDHGFTSTEGSVFTINGDGALVYRNGR